MAHSRAGPKVWLWRAVTWPMVHLSTLFGLTQEARSNRVAGRLELKMVFIRLFVRPLSRLTASVVWTEHCCCFSTSVLLIAVLYSLVIESVQQLGVLVPGSRGTTVVVEKVSN